MNKPASEEQLMSYLLEHPEVKIVISSTPLMLLLKTLKMQASSLDDLRQKHPSIDRADLIEMMDVLSQLALVKQENMGSSNSYFLTDKAREFLKFYYDGKKAFDILGK